MNRRPSARAVSAAALYDQRREEALRLLVIIGGMVEGRCPPSSECTGTIDYGDAGSMGRLVELLTEARDWVRL